MKNLPRILLGVTVVLDIALIGAILLLLSDAEVGYRKPAGIVSLSLASLMLLLFAGLPVTQRLSLRLPERGEDLVLDSFELTEREQRFILEFSEGAALKEIAASHGISLSTVHNSFSLIYAKLGVSSICELAALTARCNIVFCEEVRRERAGLPSTRSGA
jgi:Response regulator containing a CheY-like receiver domain and an HTH DNA-binding domain